MLRPASLALVLAAARLAAADATSPVDPTRRNDAFAPAGTVTSPARRLPADEANAPVQERRFEAGRVERKESPLGDRRAPLEARETRPKDVQEKVSTRPEAREQVRSPLDQRPSAISTTRQTTVPPKVARYQNSLDAASAANMARFPALQEATTAKVNRFVFRRNPPDERAPVADQSRPAAGGGR